MGHFGTLLCTENGGVNWEQHLSNTDQLLSDIHFVDQSRGFIVGDSGNRLVGSGIYLYRLQAGRYAESRKMLLIH